MQVEIEVLNHQPVPLVPLGELELYRCEREVIYIGAIVTSHGHETIGWYVADRFDLLSVECPTVSVFWQDVDKDKTMARLLQPGEVLQVRYSN